MNYELPHNVDVRSSAAALKSSVACAPELVLYNPMAAMAPKHRKPSRTGTIPAASLPDIDVSVISPLSQLLLLALGVPVTSCFHYSFSSLPEKVHVHKFHCH